MKNKIAHIIIILIFSIGLFSEKTIDQEIKDLEQKLKTASEKEKVNIFNQLTEIYIEISLVKALENGLKALKLSQKIKDPRGEAIAEINIGYVNLWNFKFEEGLKNAQKSLNIFKKLNDKKGMVDSLNILGHINYFQSKNQNALKYLEKSLKISEKLKYKKGIVLSLIYIGIIHKDKGNYIKSLDYFKKSLKLSEDIKYKKKIISSLQGIGNLYMLLCNYDEALNYSFKALELSENLGYKTSEAYALQNIGITYYRLNNQKKALEFYFKSLKIMREIKDKMGEGNILEYIGNVYKKSGNLKKALEYFSKSLKIREELGIKSLIGGSYLSLGTVHLKLKNYDNALEYFVKSLKIIKKYDIKYPLAMSLNGIGEIYITKGNYKKAVPYLDEGLKIAKEIKARDLIKKSYNDLSKLYASIGNYKKAFEYHQLYFEVNESMFNEKSSKQIAEMQTKYDTLKKEKEIDILKKDKELLEKNSKIQRLTRNAFIGGFVLVSIILILLFKRYIYLFAFWKKQKYIGQFRLMEMIGSGGMSTLYKANNIRDKTHTVAIKVLKEEFFKDESMKKRFKQEATIIDKLDHDNIVKIFERGEDKGKLYIAMELLKGKTLDVKMEEQGKLDLNECYHIMLQIADALLLIHNKNIIHRDLKPSNIMLIEREGDFNFVKLLDFGIARMKFQTQLTKTGIRVGTVNFMAPEQILNAEFSSAGDIFSLGVIFYEMVTGDKPFVGEDESMIINEILNKTLLEPSQLQPDIPTKLNDLIKKMLEKKKESRPTTKEILDIIKQMN